MYSPYSNARSAPLLTPRCSKCTGDIRTHSRQAAAIHSPGVDNVCGLTPRSSSSAGSVSAENGPIRRGVQWTTAPVRGRLWPRRRSSAAYNGRYALRIQASPPPWSTTGPRPIERIDPGPLLVVTPSRARCASGTRDRSRVQRHFSGRGRCERTGDWSNAACSISGSRHGR